MTSTGTILASMCGDLLFSDHYAFDSPVIESLLRYIALKHSDGNNIQPISVTRISLQQHNIDETFWARYGENTIFFAEVKDFKKLMFGNDWTELNSPPFPVNDFLSKEAQARVFCNPKYKKSIVITDSFSGTFTNKQWLCRLCSVLFRLLPWIYIEDKVPEDEVEVFRLFSQKEFDNHKFTALINNVANQFNIRELAMKKTLCGFENYLNDKLIVSAEKEVRGFIDKIRSKEVELNSLLKYLEKEQMKLNALTLLPKDNSNKIYHFFQNHKQLEVLHKDMDEDSVVLSFAILDTIEFYDPDIFSAVYNNPNSNLGKAPKDVREIFWGIFGMNKGVIRVEALFDLCNLSSLSPIRGGITCEHDNTHLPHPHLYYHGCLGGNEQYIRKYLLDGDWDLAIEQAIAAVKNINFGDYVVLGQFIMDIKNRMSTCFKFIVADNGKEMTALEFLDYINNNEKEEKTNG